MTLPQVADGERDELGLLVDPVARARELLERCRDTTHPYLDGIYALKVYLQDDSLYPQVTYAELGMSEEELIYLEHAHKLQKTRDLLALCRQGDTEAASTLRSLIGISYEEIRTTPLEVAGFLETK